VLACESFSTTR